VKPAAVVLLVVGLFVALFIPAYTAQWVGYGMVLVVLLSFAYSRIIRAGLSVTRAPMDLITYRYQTAEVVIRIANRAIVPIPQLTVSDHPGSLYTGHDNVRLLSLRPLERREMRYSIRGMNRGSYRIGPIVVRYSDPLGFFPVTSTVPVEVRLIVYPSILPVELEMDRGLPAGTVTTASRIYEDPTRYRSVREYVPGDEIRRVNWKASARLGRLHSNEWLPTINFPVMVLLNLTSTDYEQRNRYHHTERTIDAAASLVHHLAERGQAVGFASTGVYEEDGATVTPWIGTGEGAARAVSILRVLASIRINEEQKDVVDLLLDRGSLSPGTRLFYLGPPLPPERVSGLLMGVRDRALLRLYYTDERVADWRNLAVQSVSLFMITEFGDELFIRQT
jgi:uncharacterized protein (DUF58 family)